MSSDNKDFPFNDENFFFNENEEEETPLQPEPVDSGSKCPIILPPGHPSPSTWREKRQAEKQPKKEKLDAPKDEEEQSQSSTPRGHASPPLPPKSPLRRSKCLQKERILPENVYGDRPPLEIEQDIQ